VIPVSHAGFKKLEGLKALLPELLLPCENGKALGLGKHYSIFFKNRLPFARDLMKFLSKIGCYSDIFAQIDH